MILVRIVAEFCETLDTSSSGEVLGLRIGCVDTAIARSWRGISIGVCMLGLSILLRYFRTWFC